MAEFTTACEKAQVDLHGRELLVDLKNLTAISPEGEVVLLQLMRKNVKFQGGIFMKELLNQPATRAGLSIAPQEIADPAKSRMAARRFDNCDGDCQR